MKANVRKKGFTERSFDRFYCMPVGPQSNHLQKSLVKEVSKCLNNVFVALFADNPSTLDLVSPGLTWNNNSLHRKLRIEKDKYTSKYKCFKINSNFLVEELCGWESKNSL